MQHDCAQLRLKMCLHSMTAFWSRLLRSTIMWHARFAAHFQISHACKPRCRAISPVSVHRRNHQPDKAKFSAFLFHANRVLEAPEQRQHDDAKRCCYHGDWPVTKPGRQADGRTYPHACPRCQALHFTLRENDDTRCQKRHAVRHSFDQPDRIRLHIITCQRRIQHR